MSPSESGPPTPPTPQTTIPRPHGEVGYGRPPRARQFKPGQSGNPKGRRKGAKNESTMLRELLHRKITIRESGKSRKVTIFEAILTRFAEDSLKGNVRSAAFLLNRYGAMVSGEVGQPDLSEDDRTVFEAFVRKLQSDPANGRE